MTAAYLTTSSLRTALKDAKTWTSDAKRAAKERREAKQREGGGKSDKETKPETAKNGTAAPLKSEGAGAAAAAAPKEEPSAPEASAIAAATIKEGDVEEKEDGAEEEEPSTTTQKKKGAKKPTKTKEEDDTAAEPASRRSSKRRNLPLSGPTATKAQKKDSELTGLDLLSQATHAVGGSKKKVTKV
jgi:hypothetical protein